MAYLKTVREAWQELENGVHENFRGKRVVKDDKKLIVMPPLPRVERALATKPRTNLCSLEGRIVVFPRLEHVPHFRKAAEGVAMGGPTYTNKGAVGSLSFTVWPIDGVIHVPFIRSHFRTSGLSPLPRSLATRYGGWRVHALTELLTFAKQHGVKVSVEEIALYNWKKGDIPKRPKPLLYRQLLNVCEALGLKVTRQPEGGFLGNAFVITSK